MIKVAFYMTLVLTGMAILFVALLWVCDNWSTLMPYIMMKGTW